MKRIILHIGNEKTGTTTIQKFLHQNKDKLSFQGYISPPFRNSNHGILTYFIQKQRWKDLDYLLDLPLNNIIKEYFIKRKKAEFINFLEHQKHSSNTLIISSEFFQSRLTDTIALTQLYTLLMPYCDSIQIIFYIRNLSEAIVSLYSTSVISGASQCLSPAMDNYFAHALNYSNTINLWESVFGKDNIKVRPFNRNEFLDGSLIADFCNQISIFNYSHLRMPKQENISLNSLQLRLIKSFNQCLPPYNPIRLALVKIIKNMPTDVSPLKLSQITEKKYIKSFKSSHILYQSLLADTNPDVSHMSSLNENSWDSIDTIERCEKFTIRLFLYLMSYKGIAKLILLLLYYSLPRWLFILPKISTY